MEALGLLMEDYLHSLKTYQRNGKLAPAMQDQMKEHQEASQKKSERVALDKFPNREDAVQAFIRYFEIQFQEVERLFKGGESIFYSDLDQKINDYSTKKYLEDTYTLSTNVDASVLKYANEHYQLMNDPQVKQYINN